MRVTIIATGFHKEAEVSDPAPEGDESANVAGAPVYNAAPAVSVPAAEPVRNTGVYGNVPAQTAAPVASATPGYAPAATRPMAPAVPERPAAPAPATYSPANAAPAPAVSPAPVPDIPADADIPAAEPERKRESARDSYKEYDRIFHCIRNTKKS